MAGQKQTVHPALLRMATAMAPNPLETCTKKTLRIPPEVIQELPEACLVKHRCYCDCARVGHCFYKALDSTAV